MELRTKDYGIWYDLATQTVTCEGTLRLSSLDDYTPIINLLSDVARQQPPHLTLNLRNLKFLNSSGFNILSKFVLQVRQIETIQLVVQATKRIPWHERSLKNLQRLMPTMQLEFDEP